MKYGAMICCRCLWIIVACSVFFLFTGFSFAESSDEPALWKNLDIGGYIRGESHIPAMAEEESETTFACTADLKAKGFFNEYYSAFIELRGRAYGIGDDHGAKLDLREGYLKFNGDWLDIMIGQQIIAWGQADGINPTDNLCARNKTIFSSEPDDQRRGAPALKSDLFIDNFTITGAWQLYRESKVLGPFFPEKLEVKPGNKLRPLIIYPADQINILSPDLPDKDIRDSSIALKCSVNMSSLDLSISYFHGYSTYPDYQYSKIKHGPEYKFGAEYDIAQKFDRLNIFGADFALAIDPFVIRGEAAYIKTGFDDEKHPQRRQPYLHYVIGPEWQCTEDLVVSTQYSMKYIPDFKTVEDLFGADIKAMDEEQLIKREITRFNRKSHSAERRVNDQLTLRVTSYFLQKTLMIEIKGAYQFGKKEYRISPEISYDINDRINVTAAAGLFFGPKESQFDMRGKSYNQCFLEIKYSF